MTVVEIPIPTKGVDNFTFSISLDYARYTFLFVWNYRGSYWSMSIADAVGSPVVQGVCVRVSVDMLEFVSATNRPQGSLVAMDTAGAGVDPGLNDLGQRVILLYGGAARP